MLRAWLLRSVFAPDAGGSSPAAAPSAAAAATPAAGAGAAGASTAAPVAFAESLPEDIRGEAVFRDIKDLGSLAKGYLHAQRLIGHDPKNLLVMPAPDDADAWNGVYARLGRPEKPDGYQLAAAPEGVQPDEALRGTFLAKAHEAGLSNKQADALYSWWNGEAATRAQAAAQAATQAQDAATASLKSEWGQAYDQRLDAARRALAHYGDEKLAAKMEATGLGNDPDVVRLFAKLGAQLQEDGLVGRAGEGAPGMASPGEARQQISGLYTDKTFMASYMDKRSPGHAEAVARMAALHEQAYPQTS